LKPSGLVANSHYLSSLFQAITCHFVICELQADGHKPPGAFHGIG